MGEFIGVAIVILVVLGIIALAISSALKRLLYICSPNEVLVFSGTVRNVRGRQVGYKTIKGGRAIRIPLFEVVDRMDLTNMPIDLEVSAAYSKGGIPLNVVGIANVKVAGHQPVLDNAIERFLGKSRNELMLIAKDTLEGTLRGVLATLTPEEVNEDKIKFAHALLEEATDDLNRLGLALDTLKIQDVSDDVKYLDSIGRKRSAEIQRRASIAESEARSSARVREAQNHQETELRRISADVETVTAENKRRIADAVTKGAAMVAESRGQVAAQLAEASAQLDVQRARIEREKRRLSADVLEPARAEKSAKEANARADAARIIEQGRAHAQAMTELSATWQKAGAKARDVFLMQKLDAVLRETISTMGDLKVDELTVLGFGNEGGSDGDLARRLIGGNEQLRAALGVDLASSLATKLGMPPLRGGASSEGSKIASTSSENPPRTEAPRETAAGTRSVESRIEPPAPSESPVESHSTAPPPVRQSSGGSKSARIEPRPKRRRRRRRSS